MNDFRTTRRAALGALAAGLLAPAFARAAGVPAAASASSALPADSLYRLDVPLTDQHGRPFHLADLRGSPVLASMFYASCDMVCPLIFETIAMTLREAGPKVAARARVLMVSFDPERDTVEVLRQTAEDHHATDRWTLARGTDDAARQVAAVLKLQYRKLDGGAVNHSSTITLLDADGRAVERSGKLGEVDPVLVKGLQRLA